MSMETKTAPPSVAPELDHSLVRGGPFYRAQQAARLIRPNDWNHARRVPLALAVGWLPLILITAATNPSGLASVIGDYRVHSRMLIAVPVLLFGQLLMESRFRMVVRHIVEADLLDTLGRARMNDMIAMLRRLRDSVVPETAILVLLIAHTLTSFKGQVDVTPWLAYRLGPDIHLTPAGWYAVVVSTTLFQFLLGLGLWQWLLWFIFAFKLSRLDLKLVPTHPDGSGGLGFLALTTVAFAPISFAAAAVIGSTWRHEILHHGVNPMTFKLDAIVLLIIIVFVAFGPLAFFVPRLAALRRQGILEYGTLGQIHSTDFHEKWILHRAGHESDFLTAPESSALADYGSSYEKVQQLQPFPADKGAFIVLAISLVVPMLPVILAVIPLDVVLKSLLEALR
jgi:hypothetical protein